jgi:hypothetical protein
MDGEAVPPRRPNGGTRPRLAEQLAKERHRNGHHRRELLAEDNQQLLRPPSRVLWFPRAARARPKPRRH